jgi:hypothetical protein
MVEAVDSGRWHDWEGGRVWYRREGAGRPVVFALRDYDERPLVVCTVGGTAVGVHLLRLCAAAFPHLARRATASRCCSSAARGSSPSRSGRRTESRCAAVGRAWTSISPPATRRSSRAAARRRSAPAAAALIYELAGERARGDTHVGRVAVERLTKTGERLHGDLQSAPRHWADRAERTREEARS